MMTCSASGDHRYGDAAIMRPFFATMRGYVEDPAGFDEKKFKDVVHYTEAHANLYLGNLQAINDAIAATANGGKPLVIDFTATWCPPCKRIGPIYEGLIAKYPELVMKKIDVDANRESSQAAQISAMPTFKVYKNGAEVETMKGASDDGLIALLDKAKTA